MKKAIMIMIEICIVCLLIYLTGCTKQVVKTSSINSDPIYVEGISKITQTQKKVMFDYIAEYLRNAYSKHYIVNSVECRIVRGNISNGKIIALIYANINSNLPYKNSDNVSYIREVKKLAQSETDLKRKKELEKKYELLVKDYSKPKDTNNSYKFTAKLKNNKIDVSSIKLYVEIDGYNDDETPYYNYIPADEVVNNK